ncbi:MAG: UDP-N-acetylmuramoyl-L-alanine--D-glutamate ligase [Bacteroidetes bacterium]|nr:MAG: UDP-N-acetylmuramoyl-L-alanine--D-glutamate ligase [Bacteroidota bacterium]PTM15152.1 MAG: UDP-N-acetylmuramoyl-L-alanine--D-glutamate ligase [Bacteroidota bacterium]
MKHQTNIVVLGGGESGVGAALLAKKNGASVFLSDRGEISAVHQAELLAAGIAFETGQHTRAQILQASEVIKSPGIPDTVPLVLELVAQGIPVIGEIEYAARFTQATLLAITGSNGKTTTAYLTHHLLNAGGIKASLVGNVGISFARSLAEGDEPEVFVIEISSFQLDSIRDFRPRLAAILNITPDHLDRYNYDMAGYTASKMRITMNQQATDELWYLAEDEHTKKGLATTNVKAQLHPISKAAIMDHRLRLADGWLDLNTTQLRGRHNALNALFATGMAQALGIGMAVLQEGLNTFQPVPHRLEPVGEVNGVIYINDSKATNVDAVTYALEAMTQPIIWIAGGTDKGNDYEPLFALAKNKVQALICLGADNTKLKAAFADKIDTIRETSRAEDAVQAAFKLAQPGQVVLLSPACASFDLFKNYIDRGDQFRAAVQALITPNLTTAP